MRKLLNEELNRLDVEAYKRTEKNPVIIVLDNIRSLNNIGVAFRTSDAFLIEAIFLCGITACPPHRDIHKTALGSTESVDWKYFSSTREALSYLKKNGYEVISVEQADDSINLLDFRYKKEQKYALIFGNEVRGVEQEVVQNSDFVVEIPQFGTKHSLNISVSIGVVLWDYVFKINNL
ncbi:MAG: RNA methyltransferase [Bacteroidales bacterium]|nr:RNA methyltransferase [Bacteroidales bacterium]